PPLRHRHLGSNGIPIHKASGWHFALAGGELQIHNHKTQALRGGFVFFTEPTRSEFDINFRLFGVPVRIHPTFWLFSAILGWDRLDLGFEYLLLWIGCFFVSIMVHEMGHVFMGQVFGRPSHVVLYGMGGMAIGDFQIPGRWRRIGISFGGPAAGLLLWALIWSLWRFAIDPAALARQPALLITIDMLLWMNLWWNLLNLLPIWPLDGGHISRELFSAAFHGNGIRYSLGFSFLVAALAAVYSLIADNNPELWYPAIHPRF